MAGADNDGVAAVDLAVLIPALNCEATIGDVVSGARRFVETVLVVDDGSTDATARRAAESGAGVVRHEANRGKGAALRTGMLELERRGFRRVLAMDGDGQHLAREIPALVAASDANPGALIVGARRIKPGAVAPLRLFGNRFANRWVEIACGARLPDTQSGFRIYPLSLAPVFAGRSGHFAFETEVLIRAVRGGVVVESVPVEVYYPPIAERVSHYRPFVDTVRIIFVVLGLVLRRCRWR